MDTGLEKARNRFLQQGQGGAKTGQAQTAQTNRQGSLHSTRLDNSLTSAREHFLKNGFGPSLSRNRSQRSQALELYRREVPTISPEDSIARAKAAKGVSAYDALQLGAADVQAATQPLQDYASGKDPRRTQMAREISSIPETVLNITQKAMSPQMNEIFQNTVNEKIRREQKQRQDLLDMDLEMGQRARDSLQRELDKLEQQLDLPHDTAEQWEEDWQKVQKIEQQVENLDQKLKTAKQTQTDYQYDQVDVLSQEKKVQELRLQQKQMLQNLSKPYDDIEQQRQKYIAYQAVKKRADEEEETLRQAKRVQGTRAYEVYRQDPEFQKYAKMGWDLENPGWYQGEGGGGMSIFGWQPFAEETANPVKFYLENVKFGGEEAYEFMTKEELNLYNYILAKKGKDDAQGYLDALAETLNARRGLQFGKQARDIDNDVLRTLSTAGYGVVSGLDQFTSGVKSFFSDGYRPTTAIQYGSQYVRDDLAETGPKILGSSLGQVAYDLVTTSANMAPSVLLSTVASAFGAPLAIAKAIGSISLGLSASGNAYQQALAQGYAPDKAKSYSLLIGASEAGLEYVLGGISSLGKNGLNAAAKASIRNIDNAMLRIAANVGLSMFGEGSEEYIQEILEPAFRNLLLDEDNEIKLVSEDAAYSFLLGALTAGILDGGHVARETSLEIMQENAKLLDVFEAGRLGARADKNAASGTMAAGGIQNMLTEADLDDYLAAGTRKHVRDTKSAQLQQGQSPILTTVQQVKDFIKKALHGQVRETVKAYGRATERLVGDVLAATDGQIDISGYYMELSANEIGHLAKHVGEDVDSRNIPLTEEQALSLPEYIQNYDDIIEVNRRKNGTVRVMLGKKINGHTIIIETVSKGRKSLHPVTAYQVSTQWYEQNYKPRAEAAYYASRTAEAAPIPLSTSALGNTSIPQGQTGVNTEASLTPTAGQTAMQQADQNVQSPQRGLEGPQTDVYTSGQENIRQNQNGPQNAASGAETADGMVINMGSAEQGTDAGQNLANSIMPPQTEMSNAHLTEEDLQAYLHVGEREHVRNAKKAQVNRGDSPILTTVEQIKNFIRSSFKGNTKDTIKGYGRVGTRFAEDVAAATDGAIDISGYYLELDSNQIAHMGKHVGEDADVRNIPLTEEQLDHLTEYIDTYDDIVAVNRYKDGGLRVTLGKKINGHSIIIEAVSKGRHALHPVTAFQISTEKYERDYKTRAADRSSTSHVYENTQVDISRPAAAPAESSIPQGQTGVNTEASLAPTAGQTAMQQADQNTQSPQRGLEGPQTPLYAPGQGNIRQNQNGPQNAISDAIKTLGENGQETYQAVRDTEVGRQYDDATFFGGFVQAYQAGLTGKNFSDVKGEHATKLTEGLRLSAYAAGQQDATIAKVAKNNYTTTKDQQGTDKNGTENSVRTAPREGTAPEASAAEAKRRLAEVMEQYGVTEDEAGAVIEYKSSESYKVNAKLRDGTELTPHQKRMVSLLDRALEKLPKVEGTVYRTVSFDDVFDAQEEYDAFLAQHIEDGFVTYNAYTSTSTKSDGHPLADGTKLGVILEITGSNARNLEGFGNNFESEALFPRDTDFIITEVTVDESGYPRIFMKEVQSNGEQNGMGLHSQKRSMAVRGVQETYSAHGDVHSVSDGDSERDQIRENNLQGARSEVTEGSEVQSNGEQNGMGLHSEEHSMAVRDVQKVHPLYGDVQSVSDGDSRRNGAAGNELQRDGKQNGMGPHSPKRGMAVRGVQETYSAHGDVHGVSEGNPGGDHVRGNDLQGTRSEVTAQEQTDVNTKRQARTGDVEQMKGKEAADYSDEWTAERVGSTDTTPKRLAEIVEGIRHDFGVHITTGHIRGKNVRGQYSQNEKGIRSKIAQDLPTIAHELGHHLDTQYALTERENITEQLRQELLDGLSDETKQAYQKNKWLKEGMAEYLRRFLQNRQTAAIDYPKFTDYFLGRLSGRDLALIEQLADDVNAYYSLDADTATSSIRLREEGTEDARTLGEKAKEKSSVLYQAWVDSNEGIKKFDRATGSNTYILASNAAYSDAMAGNMINGGDLTDADGQYVGPGLKTVLQGLDLHDGTEQYRLFGEYLTVVHGQEWIAEGKRVFADDRKNSSAWMASRQEKLETDHPEFREIAERLRSFWHSFMETWGVNTGLVSQEQLDELEAKYPNYVPFNRVLEKGGGIGAKRGFANQSGPIKRAFGSGLDIVHPVDGIINNMVKMVNAGVRNNVMRKLTDAAATMGADATFIEKVPTPMKATKVDMTVVKDRLAKLLDGASLDESSKQTATDAVMSLDDILLQYGRGKAFGDVVTVMKNGKPEFWKVNDPQLLASITNMSAKTMDGILDAYAIVSRFMTSNITGNNIVWSIFSNAPRDAMTFFTYSKNKNIVKMAQGVGSAYLNKAKADNADPLYKEYLAMGGGNISAYTADRDLAKKARDRLFKKGISANPLDWLAFVSDTVESGPRFATYKLMRQAGMTPQEAFYEAMDITVNFRRGGTIARQINKVLPFFNANVQGLDKFRRWITAEEASGKNRKKVVAGRTSAYIVASAALAAIAYIINAGDEERKEEYEQLSTYVKNSYWNIPIGDGRYFSIPKPREIGVLSSFFETCMEYKGGNTHAFDDFYAYATDNFLPAVASDIAQIPVNGLKESAMGVLGSLGIIGVVGYLGANRDFLGRPIVASGLQNLEPKDQYTERNSKIAYWMGQAFDQSPAEIDYFFEQVLGGWWKYQKALFPVGEQHRDLTLGVKNSYIKDNQYSTDLTNWLYDRAEQTKRAKNSDPTNMDKAIDAKLDSNMMSFYGSYYKLAKNKAETTATRGTRQLVLDMIGEYRKGIDNGTSTPAQTAVEEVCKANSSTEYLPSVMPVEVTDGSGEKHLLSDIQYVEYQTDYLRIYWETVEDTLPDAESAAEQAKILIKAKQVAKEKATARTLGRIGATESKFTSTYGDVSNEDITNFLADVAIADDKSESGKAKKADVVDIISNMDLDNDDAWVLYLSKYDSQAAYEAREKGIPARLYMTAKADMEDIAPDYDKNGKAIPGTRRSKVEAYLKSVCDSYGQYLFLLGTEYSSVKDDEEYVKLFGKE